MKLHIKERILLPGLLPSENSFLDFNMKKNILKKIQITPEEQEHYKIENKDNQIKWDAAEDIKSPVEIDFTSEEIKYMKQSFEANSDKKLSDEMWMVVDRIYNEA